MRVHTLLLMWVALFGAGLCYEVDDVRPMGQNYTMEAGPTSGPTSGPTAGPTSGPTVGPTSEEPERRPTSWVGDRPGFEAKITHHGLSYVAQIAIDTLMEKLRNLTIPDMGDNIGPVSVRISGVRMVSFPRPRSLLRPLPSRGMRWKAAGLSPILKANYEAEFSFGGLWKTVKRGTMTVEGRGIQFVLDFIIGRDLDGQPTVTVYDCNAKGDISIKFEGDLGNMLNLGTRVFKNKIKSIILTQLCDTAKAEINDQASWALSRFQLVQDIPPYYEIDFSLVRFPSFKPGSLHSYHKGAFYYSPNHQEPPFQPAQIPYFPKHRKKMVYIYVTSFMLNSAFYAAYANGKLSANITSGSVPPSARKYFATSCPDDICLGTLLPQLSMIDTDGDFGLSVYATDSPRLHVDSGNMRLTGTMGADIYSLEDRKAELLMSIALNATAGVMVVVENGSVLFNVTELTSSAKILSSALDGADSLFNLLPDKLEYLIYTSGAFIPIATIRQAAVDYIMDGEVFETMVNMASQEFLLPVLREFGQTGFTIPETENMRLVRPEVINVKGLEGVMVIASDFEYIPPV